MRARLHEIRGAFRRGGPDRIPSRAPAWSAASAGRRTRLLHVFIDVRKPRLDHWSAAFAGLLLAACATTASAESMFQRALPWTTRTSRTSGKTVAGTAAFDDRSSPLDRQPPKVRRARGRGHPSLVAPSRDCSRERLCPNPDRFRHLVSRSLPVTLPGAGAGERRSRRRGAH
jgi:hypothetical protein